MEFLINFSKVAGYNINMQKSIAFYLTNEETTKKEIKKTIPFIIAPKWINYLEKNRQLH